MIPSLVEYYLQKRQVAADPSAVASPHASSPASKEPATTHGGFAAVNRRIPKAPARRVVASLTARSLPVGPPLRPHVPLPAIAPNSGSTASTARGPHSRHPASTPSSTIANSVPLSVHAPVVGEAREKELLEAFRHRKEHFQEALQHVGNILQQLSQATEFVPREEQLRLHPDAVQAMRLPPEAINEDPRSILPNYVVKPNRNHELRILADVPGMEDPFLLDDIDNDEQQELGRLLKNREEARQRSLDRAQREKALNAVKQRLLSEQRQQQHHRIKAAGRSVSPSGSSPNRSGAVVVVNSPLDQMEADVIQMITNEIGVSSVQEMSPMELQAAIALLDSRTVADRLIKRQHAQQQQFGSNSSPMPSPRSLASGSTQERPNGDTPEVEEDETLSSHPSEVARKRRIIRKLWRGSVVHLRDLYASKAGGFYAMRDVGGNEVGGSGGGSGNRPPLPFLEFDVGGALDDEDAVMELEANVAVHAPMASNSVTARAEASEDVNGDANGTDDAAGGDEGERTPSDDDPTHQVLASLLSDGSTLTTAASTDLDRRAIPPVPPFSSRSLAWITEAICRDANVITLRTESMLRAVMNQGSTTLRHSSSVKTEVDKCRFLVKKAAAWCDAAMHHAKLFESGEATVSSGVAMEVEEQRRQLLLRHDYLAEQQRSVDDAESFLEDLRAQVEEHKQRNAQLLFACDPSSTLTLHPSNQVVRMGGAGRRVSSVASTLNAVGSTPSDRLLLDDIIDVLYRRMSTCASELDVNARRRFAVAPDAVPATLTELNALHAAAKRLVEVLMDGTVIGGGASLPTAAARDRKSLASVTASVMKARTMIRRTGAQGQQGIGPKATQFLPDPASPM